MERDVGDAEEAECILCLVVGGGQCSVVCVQRGKAKGVEKRRARVSLPKPDVQHMRF